MTWKQFWCVKNQGRIQDFAKGSAKHKGGGGHQLIIRQIFPKLHENEENWTQMGETKILLCRSATESCTTFVFKGQIYSKVTTLYMTFEIFSIETAHLSSLVKFLTHIDL